ncbi:MAG TPA: GGDEF domain-containing protein [Burkholderiaceae bacterium]|nr:GGDEF domain-containing protein [Burkholderiaceae bacterium]
MDSKPARPSVSAALRMARRAWALQHVDSPKSIALAKTALALALERADIAAEGWARLVHGFHSLYFATPVEAAPELTRARVCFEASGDRAGAILAEAGLARGLWRSGRSREALEKVLALRDEGLQVLGRDLSGILLNTIAGCYSAQGQSEQAFAYMYQALRGAGPRQGHGFDAVLHCNLAHELLQLGDCPEALRHIDQGIERCAGLVNSRLLAVLLINRIICLIELGRPAEALPDIERVLELPTDESGRGTMSSHFETFAIAAFRAGETALGHELAQRAADAPQTPLADEQVERIVAAALDAQHRGEMAAAADHLDEALPLVGAGEGGIAAEGLSLRTRCLYFLAQADLHERRGEQARALEALRAWQRVHQERAQLASRARYQAAALHTELLRMQHQLEDSIARRRRTERARAELEAVNQTLSSKIEEVQSLQEALRQQATRDFLTGLFNRRHLNDVLPPMLALAARDRQALAVAIIDLDHFKAVNDAHGHAAGDAMLTALGELLVKQGRKSDVACRYGGEEFCLLMPRTDAQAARRKLVELLRIWRGMVFRFDGATLVGQTFSAGVCDSRGRPQAMAALLKAADDALLAAKQLGRARVLSASDPAPRQSA